MDLSVIQPHAVGTQVWRELLLHRPPDEEAQVVLHRLRVEVNAEGVEEKTRVSHSSRPVLVDVVAYPSSGGVVGQHADDGVEPVHGQSAGSGVEVVVFPKEGYFFSFVKVVAHRLFGCVVIVSESAREGKKENVKKRTMPRLGDDGASRLTKILGLQWKFPPPEISKADVGRREC